GGEGLPHLAVTAPGTSRPAYPVISTYARPRMGRPSRVPSTRHVPSQYVTPVDFNVASSWSAESGVIVVSRPSERTARVQTPGYVARVCGDVHVDVDASATSVQAIAFGGPDGGTNVPAENGEARPPVSRMR